MTEQEMNKLADLIVEKISAKQAEYDKAFQEDMQSMIAESKGDANIEFGMISQTDLIKDQLLTLEAELDEVVENEDYAIAEKIKQKITELKTKYGL